MGEEEGEGGSRGGVMDAATRASRGKKAREENEWDDLVMKMFHISVVKVLLLVETQGRIQGECWGSGPPPHPLLRDPKNS